MLGWREFSTAMPALAARGGDLLYQYGVGLGFLATTRPDGGPRVHPICPILDDEGLYGLIVPGPKLNDLRRDPRYALHSETYAPPDQDDGFYVTGEVVWIDDPARREAVSAQFLRERDLLEPWDGFDAQELIEFRIEHALVTLTRAGDELPAGHTVWHC